MAGRRAEEEEEEQEQSKIRRKKKTRVRVLKAVSPVAPGYSGGDGESSIMAARRALALAIASWAGKCAQQLLSTAGHFHNLVFNSIFTTMPRRVYLWLAQASIEPAILAAMCAVHPPLLGNAISGRRLPLSGTLGCLGCLPP